MSKNLKTIQLLAKIAYVISSIIFVLSLVGGIGCLVALVLMTAVQGLGSEFIDLSRSLFDDVGMSMLSILYACIIGTVACVAEAILSFMAKKYFKHQLAVGTPFTYECGDKMFKLGLWCLFTPIAMAVFNAIVYVVLFAFDPMLLETDFSSTVDISTGVIFLILSVIFKHGAEVAQMRAQTFDPNVAGAPDSTVTDVNNTTDNFNSQSVDSFDQNNFDNNNN